MKADLSVEQKRDLLQKKIDKDLQNEYSLELRINKEFEDLKHLEVSLERQLEHDHSAKQLNVKH
jgi:hypothetical protein